MLGRKNIIAHLSIAVKKNARAYQVGDRFSGVEAELLRYGAILRVLRSA